MITTAMARAVLGAVALAFCAGKTVAVASSAVSDTRVTARDIEGATARKMAVESYLRHIYAVYFGIRACTEISARDNDGSFRSEVTLDEARRTLRLIDTATAEVGVDANGIWSAAASLAAITAEALKTDPARHVSYCRKMGALFRTDAANLQANLRTLGAKTPLIPKDY